MKSKFTISFFLCSLLFMGLLVSCNKGTSLEPTDRVNLEEGLEMYFPFDGNSTETIAGVTYDTHGATYSHDRFNRPKSSLCLSKNYLNVDVGMADSIGTLSFWVSVPDTTTYQPNLFAKGNQQLGVLRYGLRVSEGEVSLISIVNRWGIYDSITYFNPLTTASIIKPNKWHHIVVRWSDTDELVEVFVDNKVEISASYLENWFLAPDLEEDSQTMGATWTYGSHDGDYLFYFKGQVDELRRYNRRISDEEIEALYTIEE